MLAGLIEKAITAILAAGMAIYANDIRQDDKLDQMKRDIQQIHEDIRQMHSELYIPRIRQ